MRLSPRILAASLALFAGAPHASAYVLVLTGTFSGANEAPPVVSTGTGTAQVTYDSVAHTMRVEATFSGLTGNTTAAHIHGPAAPGFSAAVMTQTPSFMGFPLGVTSGSFDHTLDLTFASSFNPAFLNNATNLGSTTTAEASLVGALSSGQAYFNIHTSTFGGGEVRANLAPVQGVPDEASVAGLFAPTLAGLLFLTRRRQRASCKTNGRFRLDD